MSYYRKIPHLDEKEQIEFDKYLTDEYRKNIQQALDIVSHWAGPVGGYLDDNCMDMAFQTILDKLATPRIYLLQAWLHKRSQEQAGIETK